MSQSPTTICAGESSVAQFYSLFWPVPPLLWPTPVLRPQEVAEKNDSEKSEPLPSPVHKCLAPALLFLCPDQSPSHFVILQRCLSAFTSRQAPSSYSKNNSKSCFLLFLFFLFFFFLQFRVHRAPFRCLRSKCSPPTHPTCRDPCGSLFLHPLTTASLLQHEVETTQIGSPNSPHSRLLMITGTSILLTFLFFLLTRSRLLFWPTPTIHLSFHIMHISLRQSRCASLPATAACSHCLHTI